MGIPEWRWKGFVVNDMRMMGLEKGMAVERGLGKKSLWTGGPILERTSRNKSLVWVRLL